jgi:hypothetical protein
MDVPFLQLALRHSSLILLMSMPAVDSARAAEWLISRARMSGACHVQLETSRPYLGEPLPGKYPNRKASCDRAKALHTSDVTDTAKCFDYTQGAKDGCRADGVNLP